MIEADDYDDYTQDDNWFDNDYDDREPDPEDAEIARSYAEHYEHCDDKHGGGECDCRTPRWLLAKERAQRLYWNAAFKLKAPLCQPVTVRIGPAEITLRLRPRSCMACGGKGWSYSKTGEPDMRPEGYNGVSLCGCGAAIAKLADDRRVIRQAQNEPPF